MTGREDRPPIWRREFFATRGSAHVAFAAVVWPLLTIVGAAFALFDLPYYQVSPGDALAASLVGTLLIAGDMAAVGAVVFGASVLIFRRLGPDVHGRTFGYTRLGIEPALMFLAVTAGASLWYPAILGQHLFAPLWSIPLAGVEALLFAVVIVGAFFAGRPGRRMRLAVVLITFGILSPLPLAARSALERFGGSAPDVIVLGLDSVSQVDDVAAFRSWVERRGGTWYTHAVAPGLLTNSVWASILTMQPVRAHGVFHAFQRLSSDPAFLTEARASGYRTISVFPDQLTCAVGSRAGFDEDRSGPVGWRQLLLAVAANSSIVVPIVKPALPHIWPTGAPANHAGTFTYDVRREIRAILRAGAPGRRTLLAAHLTYTHLTAYPATMDLSWNDIAAVARAAAGTVQDRSFDWKDADRPGDPVKLHAWKLHHLQRVIESEVDAARYLERGGELVVFSDHGDRAGLDMENFSDERYHRVLLATFGRPARCPGAPVSLIDIASLIGLVDTRAEPSLEFTMAPLGVWPELVNGARLHWAGDVDLNDRLLAETFRDLRRHDPWRGANQRFCGSARMYLPTMTYPAPAK